jgi:tetratricopeptide (TPR) repeat protein
MRALVAMARAQESSNPTLAALRNYQAGYDLAEDRSDNRWAKTAPALERIVLLAPHYLNYASRAMLNLDRSWDNYVYASQALRFDPEDGDAYYDRAFALRNLDMLELALADVRLATRFRTHDGWPDYEMSVILERLTRYEESRVHALKSMDDPDTRGIANELLCRSYWFTHDFATMTSCTEQLVIDFPGSNEAWRLRAVAYKDGGYPKMYDAVGDFLKHVQSKTKSQAEEVEWFKAWQVKHPRPQSVGSEPKPGSKP